MKAFKNDNIITKLCGDCDCTGFIAAITFEYDASAKTVEFTDASAYGTGGLKIIQLYIYDKNGDRVVGSIDSAGGTETLSTATLDPSGGFSLMATVVGDGGCVSDGHTEAVGISITDGALGYWDKDNDSGTIGASESGS